MRKSRYRYKRYLLYLPKAIGDLVDTQVEYVVQLFGPAIVLLPKGLENFFSRLENLMTIIYTLSYDYSLMQTHL